MSNYAEVFYLKDDKLLPHPILTNGCCFYIQWCDILLRWTPASTLELIKEDGSSRIIVSAADGAGYNCFCFC